MILTTVLAAALVVPVCVWEERGRDKFMGSVPGAVNTYTNIPEATRKRLQARMERLAYDDVAEITGSGIRSATWRYADMRMMHFGDGSRLCGHVKTDHWAPTDRGERGLVYCEPAPDGVEHCIIVPTVCRNVSLTARVERIAPLQQLVQADAPMIEAPPAEPESFLDLQVNPRRFALSAVPGGGETEESYDRFVTSLDWPDHWQPLPWGPVSWRVPGTPVALDLYTFEPRRPSKPGEPTVPVFPGVPGVPDVPVGSHNPVIPVPEPKAVAMMGLGLVLVAWMARRRRTKGAES
jgi:PEP-CTERM motif